MNQFRNAAIRSAIAAILVLVWTVWYDGPVWAWALLAFYVVATFGIAVLIQKKLSARQERVQQMGKAFGEDE